MNAEFNWWLLIVGLVVGAGLVWLVMADSARRESELAESERAGEALWIADALAGRGRPVAPDRIEEILRLHAEYLAAPPPDDPAAPPGEEMPAPAPGPGPSDWSRDLPGRARPEAGDRT